ncbi:VTT domain-containing protein [Kurthia huakuii]|uniref:VTT domain-containing protein n=1 Tax=Kurthia huakuii TaxID=1421019 RepID=UPI000497D095|nr:VTT domain-containing protein [Kurthia huakuii]MBM7699617.1 membrane-associated protein [Kurthia huakuii]
MDIIKFLFDFIMHIDEHLVELTKDFGGWTYGFMFLIVFVETGVVIFPFLPGDSLLFASGALAAIGGLKLPLVLATFFIAAVLGDSLNFEIGKRVGTTIRPGSFLGRFISQENVDKAQVFFNKHGGKTVVIARFMPFIRTFIPFVAGASRMQYGYFLLYNIIGGALWTAVCVLAGYFFGNISFVKDNFSIVVLAIIFISVLPAIIAALKAKFSMK